MNSLRILGILVFLRIFQIFKGKLIPFGWLGIQECQDTQVIQGYHKRFNLTIRQ